jgi:ankyrin repeat protein
LQQSIEDEGKNDHWQRARGGVHAQAVGITIHTAARRGKLEVLRLLVQEDGVLVDTVDMQHMTALHYAGKRGTHSQK